MSRMFAIAGIAWLSACDTFHDLWFNAEATAPDHDSVPDEDEDCSWFEDPDNCWNGVGASAATCVPDSGREGILWPEPQTDTAAPVVYSRCVYNDTNPEADFQVTFPAPIELPLAEPILTFTVLQAQSESCLTTTYTADATFGITTAGAAGTFSHSQTGNLPTWTCPDGTDVSPTFAQVVECNESESHMPGIAISSTATELSATMIGLAGDSLLLFRCIVEPPEKE